MEGVGRSAGGFYEAVRKTFWKEGPQTPGLEAFERHVFSRERLHESLELVSIDEVKAMRVKIACGCGKSRLMSCISHKFQRTCFMSMGIPLLYQFLNGEVYGGKCDSFCLAPINA